MHTKRKLAVPLIAAVGLTLSGCAGEPASRPATWHPPQPIVQGMKSLRTRLSISVR